MAREYGKNWFSMWTDEHFCTGRLFDKLFYQVLLGQSGTNDAGICPINFRKWRKALRDGDRMPSERDLKASLVRQERRRYVFTDEDTGEVLIRSHIRRDQVYKQPALMVSALRDLASCQSPKFAAVMLTELDRIELPEVRTTTKHGERLRDSLKQINEVARTHLGSLAEGYTEPYPEPFAEDFPEGISEPNRRPAETEPNQEGFQVETREPPVVVEVEVVNSPTVGGYLGEGRAKSDGRPPQQPLDSRNTPPNPYCAKHPGGTEKPCVPCGIARDACKAWDADQESRSRQALKDFWSEVRACRKCDDKGLTETPRGVTRCLDHDWRLTSA